MSVYSSIREDLQSSESFTSAVTVRLGEAKTRENLWITLRSFWLCFPAPPHPTEVPHQFYSSL